MGSIFHIKKSMKYSGHRKLLCELSKLSKFNAFNLLGYLTNTDDASILGYKFRPKRTGFNMYAEYTRPQLTFLALHPCFVWSGINDISMCIILKTNYFGLKFLWKSEISISTLRKQIKIIRMKHIFNMG